MKYLSQFLIILGFTLAGEALQRIIPLPIPASVWGIALLFTALCLKLIKVEQVKETAAFLSSLLPLLFVSPAVKIVEDWALIREDLLGIALVLIATTGAGSFQAVAGVSQQTLLAEFMTWQMALCTMVFTLFHWPCSTTLMTVYRETGSVKKTAAAFFVPTAAGCILCLALNLLF